MARKKTISKSFSTKTKIVRPSNSNFLRSTFWKSGNEWKCRPSNDRKIKLYEKLKLVLTRKQAVSRPLETTFTKINQIVKGWINYFRIGNMKMFMDTLGQWLRHKVRVIIIKQWKKPLRIYKNLEIINKKYKCNFSGEEIFKVACSRFGWYRRCGLDIVNFILSPKVLAIRKGGTDQV